MKSLWIADGYAPQGLHRRERILPTGESALIVDLSSSEAVGLSGPRSESFIIDVAAQFSVAGVQFAPGGAFPFVDVPLCDIANQHVPLDALWGRLAAELRERVLGAETLAARLDVIERTLLARMSERRPLHRAVDYAIQELERGETTAPVSVVVDRTGLSHRRFLDIFTEQVGLTPKRFGRVRRFQRVLQHLRTGGRVHWAEIALSCGYYDQAHFIKEFELFSGINPSTYRRSQVVHVNHVPL